MPLKGNLRDFSTTSLLNLINLAKKTGTLVIDGPSQGAQMSFRNGKLIYAAMGQEDGNLALILRKSGVLSPEQVTVLQSRAAHASDKEMGLLLINAGYVNQIDIVNSLRDHMLEVVYRLFTWVEGLFRFEPTLLPGDDKITIPIELDNVILEGARRMRELAHLAEELPSLDMALKFADRPTSNLRSLNLSADEWRVVSSVNPRNSIRAIARAANLSEVEIRRIVYGLLQAGLVEVARPEGQPLAPPRPAPARPAGRPHAPPDPKQQAGVVNRLIARIRSL